MLTFGWHFLRKEDIMKSIVKLLDSNYLLHGNIQSPWTTSYVTHIGNERTRSYGTLFKILGGYELDEHERERLTEILEDELVHEEEFVKEESKLEEFLAYVKEAVLDMNDGLVEILSVTTGLAGAYSDPSNVALGGLIVGVAGTLLMGIRAFISIRVQRQVHEGIIRRINIAVRYVVHIFRRRIVEYVVKKSYNMRISKALAEESSKDYRSLSRVIAEEEHEIKENLSKILLKLDYV